LPRRCRRIRGERGRLANRGQRRGRRPTQVTGLVAAATIALVLLFLTEPLAYFRSLRWARRWSGPRCRCWTCRRFGSSTGSTGWSSRCRCSPPSASSGWRDPGDPGGRGAGPAALRALTSRPPWRSRKGGGSAGIPRGCPAPDGAHAAGLVMFRFNAPLVFFNAPISGSRRNRRSVLPARTEVVRAGCAAADQVDVTGYDELENLAQALREQGAELVIAGA